MEGPGDTGRGRSLGRQTNLVGRCPHSSAMDIGDPVPIEL
jgi:hypothetical protein